MVAGVYSRRTKLGCNWRSPAVALRRVGGVRPISFTITSRHESGQPADWEAAMTLTRVPISPTGMRLHEWIALERGYFQEQGIEPEIRWDVVRGQMASWKGKAYLERPQDQPFQGGEQTITNACAWGSVCNAGAGM